MMATARRATITTTTTTMATRDGQALNDDGTRELATDDDGQGMRTGGDQRRHSAFIRCNN
jgi:hypothetical protein